MDVLNQKIKVRVNNFNEDHFKSLGYQVKRNEYIEIFINELPSGSGLKIEVECFYCHKIFKKSYRRFLETKDKICCDDCKKYKMMEKSLEKYGDKCSLRNEAVQEKSKNKNMKNLGVQYPFQNKNILKKCVESSIGSYGDRFLNGSISKPQKHIYEIFGGKLNHCVFPYRIDIFFEDEKIYFEYDGSGHALSVKMNQIDERKFIDKENKRRLFFKEKGYKEFRIISKDDILPSDEYLNYLKERAFYILLVENYNHYYFDLNTEKESFEN